MIPNVLVTLDALPLTSIGKIDRTALPKPEQDLEATAARTFQPPTTPTEQKVAATLAGILGVSQISTGDNFFALGGTSLQAARAVLELRRACGVDVAVGEFYAAADARQIAESIDRAIALRDEKERDEQRLAADIADLEQRLAHARAAQAQAVTTGSPDAALPDSAASPAEGGHQHG
jgi:hypothetical protein